MPKIIASYPLFFKSYSCFFPRAFIVLYHVMTSKSSSVKKKKTILHTVVEKDIKLFTKSFLHNYYKKFSTPFVSTLENQMGIV